MSIESASRDLAELTQRHGTDKGPASVTRSSVLRRKHTLSGKGYTATYGRFFAEMRDQPIRLLEIGVDRGASIPVWEDFFPSAKLSAIDIDAKCKRYETDRTRIYIGDQTDPDFLQSVSAQSGPFNVIIDDGGHMMQHHYVSLTTLWPLLSPGGLYFVEDLHTAYQAEFGGGYRSEESTVERLKHLIDGFQVGDVPRVVEDLAGIWFAKSICVLVKAGPDEAD